MAVIPKRRSRHKPQAAAAITAITAGRVADASSARQYRVVAFNLRNPAINHHNLPNTTRDDVECRSVSRFNSLRFVSFVVGSSASHHS